MTRAFPVSQVNSGVVVDGPVGSGRNYYGTTLGSPRWVMQLGNSGNESGNNAGSDFGVTRYTDAGAAIDTPLFINRANGNATFNAALTVAGGLTVNGVATFVNTPNMPGYLPIAGGTVTGNLSVNGTTTLGTTQLGYAHVSGNNLAVDGTTTTGGFTNYGGWTVSQASTAASYFVLNNSAGTLMGYLVWNNTNNTVSLINANGANMSLNTDGSTSFSGGINCSTLNTTGGAGIGGGLGVTQTLSVNGGHVYLKQASGDYSYVLNNGGGVFEGSFACRGGSDSAVGIFTNFGGGIGNFYVDTGGNFWYTGGTAYKSGGGSWTNYSDARIKNVVGDYAKGLKEVLQLRPILYTYKGNDTPSDDVNHVVGAETKSNVRSAPYPASMHYGVAKDKREFVGLVAQEVEAIFPDMVGKREGYIDGKKVTDLRDLDVSSLIYALVNSVKTLSERLASIEETLKAR